MAKIFITQFDYDRLMSLLNKKKPHDEFDKALLSELENSEVVEPQKIPPDVITMNSEVRFTDSQGEDWHYSVVFPEDADFKSHKISILSPIGCALLGQRVGDEITLHTPHGERKLKVEEILHQPEAEGNYNL